MPLTYPDQNALIALGREARLSTFRKKLFAKLESGQLTIVVSTWHLVETANTENIEKAMELANFIESMKPLWLLERRDIQSLEVEEDFLSFLGIESPTRPRVTTRSAAIAALNYKPDAPKFDIPSTQFVKQWIENPEQLRIIEEVYKKNASTLPRLRELRKQGKLTDKVRRRVDELLIMGLLPKQTPAGLHVAQATKAEYAKQAKIEAIPSLAIESAISEHEWASQGGTDRNTLIDKFHLISALPYVNEIVSNDKFFHKVYPVAQKTGHVKARLIGNADFLRCF
ncbi:MAG: hypothetical protein ACYDCM_16900 [Candidatus Acidiferrales bacterium]